MCTGVTPSAGTATFFSQSQGVLPANGYSATLNDAAVTTAISLASYVANDTAIKEFSALAANRSFLNMIPLTVTTTKVVTSPSNTGGTTVATFTATTTTALASFNAASAFTDVANRLDFELLRQTGIVG